MRFIRTQYLDWRVASQAEIDAAHELYAPEDAIISVLGPRPPRFDPINRIGDGVLAARLADPTIEELRDERFRLEDRLAGHPRLWTIRVKKGAAYAVETVASIGLLHAAGVEPPESWVVGSMAGAFLFYATNHAAQAARDGRRSPRFWWTIIGYSIVILSIGLVRGDALTGGEGSSLADLALSIVLLAASIGPAFVAEAAERDRKIVEELTNQHRAVARRLKEKERGQVSARNDVITHEHAEQEWEHDAERLRAVYNKNHRKATTKEES